MKPERPTEIPGVRKSSRVKFQTKQDYIPITTGSKFAVIMVQLEYKIAIHPDAHMFSMKIQKEPLEVITAIFTQIEKMGN